MVAPQVFLNALKKNEIQFFTGVPDSLMKDFLHHVEKEGEGKHIVAANEGAAISMASGYHLATGKIPLVYLQNSGIGNLINPLTSLADAEVYGIPMLLLIGWRGQPGTIDEPQHKKMGRVTLDLLSILEIPYFILGSNAKSSWESFIEDAIRTTSKIHQPVALVVESGFFSEDKKNGRLPSSNEINIVGAIETIKKNLVPNDLVVCTTGKIGRVFYSINQNDEKPLDTYFLNIGAMGHANSIAAMLSSFSKKRVVLFDGDGALLMHMGALATIGQLDLPNFIYVVYNNGAHESVGGQPTVALDIDLCAIARACGFSQSYCIKNYDELTKFQLSAPGKVFIEIQINLEVPETLPRPNLPPREAKYNLMQSLLNKTKN